MRGLLLAMVSLGCLTVGNGFFFSSFIGKNFGVLNEPELMSLTTPVQPELWSRADDARREGADDTQPRGRQQPGDFSVNKGLSVLKKMFGDQGVDDELEKEAAGDGLGTSAYRQVTEQLLQLVNDSYLGMLQLPPADVDNVTDHWVNRTAFAVHLVTQFKDLLRSVKDPSGYDEEAMRRYYVEMKQSWERSRDDASREGRKAGGGGVGGEGGKGGRPHFLPGWGRG